MSELFASGRIVDAILALVVVEALLIALVRRRTGRGIALPALVWNLLAGCALLLALRAALTGAAWPWIALWLGAAFVMHVADVWSRARPSQEVPARRAQDDAPATSRASLLRP